jgi:hypothetical protein
MEVTRAGQIALGCRPRYFVESWLQKRLMNGAFTHSKDTCRCLSSGQALGLCKGSAVAPHQLLCERRHDLGEWLAENREADPNLGCGNT